MDSRRRGSALRISDVGCFALSLPETTEQPHFELSSFRVRSKIFATVPPGGTHLRLFVGDAAREAALAAAPQAFTKLWWGKSVQGVEATLAVAPPALVEELLVEAWRAKAPKQVASDYLAGSRRPR